MLNILGKLFVSILNEHLTKFAEKIKLVNENQAGFRKGYRTTDHSFTLSLIINHTMNVKKKPVYACFVDFKKAFDNVSHNILWSKLINYGIDGKFLDLVESMYSKVKSCIRSNNGLAELFLFKGGLHQGSFISPLLFSFISPLLSPTGDLPGRLIYAIDTLMI